MLTGPVNTLGTNGEVRHPSRLQSKERGREMRPLEKSHTKSSSWEGGVGLEKRAKEGVGRELEVFEKAVGEVLVRETTDADTSGRTPQNGVNTNIGRAKKGVEAGGSGGEN
jgi:hypothetical protein